MRHRGGGGGILGLAVARELAAREPDARICLLEAEGRLAAPSPPTTRAWSTPGLLMRPVAQGEILRRGRRQLPRLLRPSGNSPRRASGKLIVATGEAELPCLDELERRGQANGVKGLARVEPDEIAEIEPAARGLFGPVLALHSRNRLRGDRRIIRR